MLSLEDIPIGSFVFLQQEKSSAREKGIHSFTGHGVLPRMLVSASLRNEKKTQPGLVVRTLGFVMCQI